MASGKVKAADGRSHPQHPLPAVIEDYLTDLVTIRGSSRKTADNYVRDLRQFFRFLKAKRAGMSELIASECEEFEQLPIDDCELDFIASVTPGDILSFLKYCGEVRGNESKSIARKLSSVKGFFKYHHTKRRAIPTNPAADVEGPRPKKSLPKFLSFEESVSLLGAVDADIESPQRRRDYCIITLLLNCGMRLAELCSINLSDIDRELRSLRVVGKGSKERIIYLNDACRTALADYIRQRSEIAPQIKSGHTDALFISRQYRRISHPMVQVVVEKYLAAAGLDNRGYSVHKLRHTAATLMYQSGVDVRVLKDILGHEQLNTTQIYTHVSDRNMEEAMQKNPLASASASHTKKSRRASKVSEEDSEDESDD